MGMQHEIGEQADELAIATWRWVDENRRVRRRGCRRLEQYRQSLPHAVETKGRYSFAAALSEQKRRAQGFVVCCRGERQALRGRFFYGFFLRAIARSMLRG